MLLDWRDSPKLPRSGYYTLRQGSLVGLVVHNTGGLEDISQDNDYHRFQAEWDPGVKGGAAHIAYHLWVPYDPIGFLRKKDLYPGYDPKAVVVWCNYLWERSWHATRANDTYLGLALQLDGQKMEMSAAQRLALNWVLDHFLPDNSVSVPRTQVWGHGELPDVYGGGPDLGNNTVCPGKYVLPIVQGIRGGG